MFLASTISLRLASSAAYFSASLTMRSMSASESPAEDVIVMRCSLLVAISLALTLTMPLTSISKATSIFGMPRGAGGMPSRVKRPRVTLSCAMERSPCSTCISTEVWLSAAVEKIWLLEVGIVVLRSISLVMTPPSVSIPSDSGVTSSSTTFFTSPDSTPP